MPTSKEDLQNLSEVIFDRSFQTLSAEQKKRVELVEQLILAREETAKERVVEWLEADLKRLDSRNWTMETMVLDHLVGSGKADDYQKDKRQQIVEDRRAAHALYAILNNYKGQMPQSQPTIKDKEE